MNDRIKALHESAKNIRITETQRLFKGIESGRLIMFVQ
jgi:hypothetical protein